MPKISLLLTVSILLLSLSAWAFFYAMGWPLQAGDTTVVVGLVALVVFSAKWIGSVLFKRLGKKNT